MQIGSSSFGVLACGQGDREKLAVAAVPKHKQHNLG
jgi:hypothetical protein